MSAAADSQDGEASERVRFGDDGLVPALVQDAETGRVLTLAWMCLALSIGAISVLWILIQRGAAARVASLFYLVPPVTAVEGFLLFGEALSALQLIGIAVTATGVALANRP